MTMIAGFWKSVNVRTIIIDNLEITKILREKKFCEVLLA